jgi:hypothetical protein
MYRTADGEEIFIIDGHTHLWDGSKENLKNIHGQQFIDCFYGYHSALSPWHLSVQKHGPKSRQRQARLHQLDDAAKPSGEPGGSASGDFPGLIGGTFFSLGVG